MTISHSRNEWPSWNTGFTVLGNMKSKKPAQRTNAAPSVKSPGGAVRWPWFAAAALVVVVFWVYSPALNGPFLFDDATLPFALAGFAPPLLVWIRGVRAMLYFTYWANAQVSGSDPSSYHVVTVLFHCVTGGLVFFIVRRLLEWAGILDTSRDLLAAFAAVVFLLHPV